MVTSPCAGLWTVFPYGRQGPDDEDLGLSRRGKREFIEFTANLINDPDWLYFKGRVLSIGEYFNVERMPGPNTWLTFKLGKVTAYQQGDQQGIDPIPFPDLNVTFRLVSAKYRVGRFFIGQIADCIRQFHERMQAQFVCPSGYLRGYAVEPLHHGRFQVLKDGSSKGIGFTVNLHKWALEVYRDSKHIVTHPLDIDPFFILPQMAEIVRCDTNNNEFSHRPH